VLKKIIILLLFINVLYANENKLCDYVNPFIGTGGKGHTFPGAVLPFGMVQLSPDNGFAGWDRIAGYFYPDTIISYFSHTHLSGTGIGDLYDISFMPFLANYKHESVPDSLNTRIFSRFYHRDEKASPNFYSVVLSDYKIKVELTATLRCGFQKYIFPSDREDKAVFLDLKRAMNWDNTVATNIIIVNDSTIAGYRFSSGWAKNQKVFFYSVFSKKFDRYELENFHNSPGRAYLYFSDDTILVKTGISSVSIENAKMNLLGEIPDWGFVKVREDGRRIWEKYLRRIKIFCSDDALKTIFYTSLYHSLIAPSIISDINGEYRGFDDKVHKVDFFMFSTFSLWDTFRATHPLFTIIVPELVDDMVFSMYEQFKQSGELSIWPLWCNETECMTGYHSIPVIVDAVFKGLVNNMLDSLYLAVKNTLMLNKRSLNYYKEYGYIPYNKAHNSVTNTLEYAFDDLCAAQFAKFLGEKDDFEYFLSRSQSYRHIFNKDRKFFVGKDDKGNFFKNFNPDHYTKEYIESNAWHYTFFVPHNIQDLVSLYGGKDSIEIYLDSMFNHNPSEDDKLPIFSTGMIGQYVHGNEPDHHVPYLYAFTDNQIKSQKVIYKILTTLYTDKPDGICGNEDCGQLSSWYVFSALGFYPVNPASGKYIIGYPIVDSAVVYTQSGDFHIKVENSHSDKGFMAVREIFLNGQKVNDFIIKHKNIVSKNGFLIFKK